MTAHTPSPTSVRHSPSAGPSANLIELPDASMAWLATAADIDAHLSETEAARQRQLAALPAADLDVVAGAHRSTVKQILCGSRRPCPTGEGHLRRVHQLQIPTSRGRA